MNRREEMLHEDATWFAKVWLTIFMLGALAFIVWCFTTEPSILANWDKRVYCEVKGCYAWHASREEFPDGIRHALCKAHYAHGMALDQGAVEDLKLPIPMKWWIKKQ